MNPYLIYVIGPTNAGKSTLLEYAGTRPGVGLIEVGKMMRAKYPPSHFAGQSNPAHTAAEARQMYFDRLAEFTAAGTELIFIDGQPRDEAFTKELIANRRYRLFLHLWAPEDVRRERAMKRDGGDPAKLELSLKRLANEPEQLYRVWSLLAVAGEMIINEDTSGPNYSTAHTFDVIRRCRAQLVDMGRL